MTTLKILEQTYELPVIATEEFRTLQEQTQKQQQLIQEGTRPRPPLLGIIPRAPSTLSIEERFHELNQLIKNYDTIIATLHKTKEAWETFFVQLAAEIQQVLTQRCDDIRQIELERLADYQSAVAQQDEELQRLAREDEETLLQGIKLLGQAALLLLKKVALCQEGINKLATDQEIQRQVLSQLTRRLESHYKAYERRKRIDRMMHEVAQIANIALQFEEYMRDHFGPLQELVNQVVKIDNSLHSAVAEIEDITKQLLQEKNAFLPGNNDYDNRILEFLIKSNLKRERLAEVLDHIERHDEAEEAFETEIAMDTSSSISVLDALDNIQHLVDLRLSPSAPVRGESLPTEILWNETPTSIVSPVETEVHNKRAMRETPPVESGEAPAPINIPLKTLTNSVGIDFVLIPSGKFVMGTSLSEIDRLVQRYGKDSRKFFEREATERPVTISQQFYLSKYPVTQAQWKALMGYNPSKFVGNPNRPVEQVSWADVQAFIRRLNKHEGCAIYRLPTEAEWEYACRAGSTDPNGFCNDGSRLSEHGWYDKNAAGKTHPVGQLKPNAWGLYDMLGNVWEWVHDIDSTQGISRVVRGGSWYSSARLLRSAQRDAAHPNDRASTTGFRLARNQAPSDQ